jgi:large subunit ribosomal protein L15
MFRKDYSIVNLQDLADFDANSRIQPEDLVAHGLMTPAKGKGLIKVLGDGELSHPLTIRAHKFSASAQAKIEAAGGSIEIIPVKTYEKTKRKKEEKKQPAQVAQAAQATSAES